MTHRKSQECDVPSVIVAHPVCAWNERSKAYSVQPFRYEVGEAKESCVMLCHINVDLVSCLSLFPCRHRSHRSAGLLVAMAPSWNSMKVGTSSVSAGSSSETNRNKSLKYCIDLYSIQSMRNPSESSDRQRIASRISKTENDCSCATHA